MTHDPRTLLDTYATTETEFGEPIGQVAACAFDALRAVLDAIDFVTEVAPNAQPPAVPVSVLRGIITRALETP